MEGFPEEESCEKILYERVSKNALQIESITFAFTFLQMQFYLHCLQKCPHCIP